MEASPGPLRIGQFARRVGVTPELLRAWERRYELLQPVRSSGGFRLYTEEDAERVARMREAIGRGLSASEAARVAIVGQRRSGDAAGRDADFLEHAAGHGADFLQDAAGRVLAAIRRYDEATVHLILDENLTAFGLEATVADLIVPALTQVGLDWKKDAEGISHEHFASNLIRGRLLSLMRIGAGNGPLALLACVPGEEHDLSLLAFGLLLRLRGWRVVFFGANTPISTLTQAARATHPALVVVTSFDPTLFETSSSELRGLGDVAPLAIGGPGASEAMAASFGARSLDSNLVEASRRVSGAASTELQPAEHGPGATP
jgi:DNA-binding transcriptional MerR regulator